jgi:hypothetical protein
VVFGDQARKHLAEMRVLGARVDVLPAVSLEECGRDRPRLGLVDCAAALRREITGVGFGLGLQMPSTAATNSMNSSTARSRLPTRRAPQNQSPINDHPGS